MRFLNRLIDIWCEVCRMRLSVLVISCVRFLSGFNDNPV